MAGYAALVSFRKRIIINVLDSSRISLVPPSTEIIRPAFTELKSLLKSLKELDRTMKMKRDKWRALERRIKSREKVNALDYRIVEAVWQFEDVLESHLTDQILSQLESSGCEGDLSLFSIDLQCLQRDVDSFVAAMRECISDLNNLPEDEDESVLSVALFPRYDRLPQHSKVVFLLIGTFPRDYKIPASKLIDMLTVEGFTEQAKRLGIYARDLDCLEELVRGSDFLKMEMRSRDDEFVYYRPKKTYCVGPSWQKLCKEEARKNKFFHVISCPVVDGVQGQRRLCLHNNILFGFKEVYDSVKHDHASSARSLLCLGPYLQYSVPLNVGFKLLRVLDALRVRVYNFPIEILNLVLLQYLALSYNGQLPASISKLFNLQFLIIHRHMSIKSCGAPPFVPVQIWDMQELKHVDIMGSNLPNPNSDATLQKLSTLLGVSANSCTREVLKKIPNVNKLGIQIELSPHDDNIHPLSCFDHISQLEDLEVLKCSVVNPGLKYDGFVVPPTPLSMLPSRLLKLHLSGLGYPWKYMKAIGSLPNLEVLKLRCHAFRGPKWGTKKNSFLKLKYLLIEDSDLVQWRPRRRSFPKLSCLIIKHCYKLEEFCWPPDAKRGRITLLDCNPLAVTCAKQLKPRKKQRDYTTAGAYKNYSLSFTACSSWDDEELKCYDSSLG